MTPALATDLNGDDDPRLAIRRHTDRCFFAVEEVCKEGYVVQGILIPHADVAATCPLDDAGFPLSACAAPTSRLR